MAKDVVIYQGEFKTACSEISNHITFLIDKLKKYKRILYDIQMNGIQDELIRGKIGNVAILIDGYIIELEEISLDFSIHINAGVTAIENKDKYANLDFVFNGFSEIESIIAMLH